MLEGNADIRTIQVLMGHSNISTTSKYIHLSKKHLAWLSVLWMEAILLTELQDIFKSVQLKRLSPVKLRPFTGFAFVEPPPLVPMLWFARNVVQRMFRLIPAGTGIVLNVSIRFNRYRLRLRCLSFYPSGIFILFLRFLRN
nr:tyrosine-type recombinase/integrase [Desulfosporosinus sp. SRJS8]